MPLTASRFKQDLKLSPTESWRQKVNCPKNQTTATYLHGCLTKYWRRCFCWVALRSGFSSTLSSSRASWAVRVHFAQSAASLWRNSTSGQLLLGLWFLRSVSSIFVLHGCLLDAVKCLYSVPFATSLLRRGPPNSCAVLGGSFVLLVTASAVNIVATVCSETYSFRWIIYCTHNFAATSAWIETAHIIIIIAV